MASSMCSIHPFSSCSFRDPRFKGSESRFNTAYFTLGSFATHKSSSTTTLPHGFSFRRLIPDEDRRRIRSVAAAGPMFFPENSLVGDTFAMICSGCFALSILRIYEEIGRRGISDQVRALRFH